jgi:hypothetical protein
MFVLIAYAVTGGSKEAHLQSQGLCCAAGIYYFASSYLKTSISQQPLSEDIVNVPDPGLDNECKSSRFRVNNTFLFLGEVGFVRDSKAPCIRVVASVSFMDLPGRRDVSVRGNFKGRCDPAGDKAILRLDKEPIRVRSTSPKSEILLLLGEDDDCEATNALEVREWLQAKHDVHLPDNISHLGIVEGSLFAHIGDPN